MAIDADKGIQLAEAARRGDINALGTLLRDLVSTLDDLSDTELAFLDGVTAGTGLASKAAVLDSSGNFIMPDNGVFGLSRAAVAAAGSTSADATVLADQVNAVTGADGTKGVALPLAATTEGPLWVINTNASNGLKVYPVDGGDDNINGEAEDAAVTLGPAQMALFIPTSATQWYCPAVSLIAATATELDYLAGLTPGTQAASKAVVADANVNTGVSKVTELHIGASGSEVQLTATPAEINAIADVSARVQELTVSGAVTAGVTMIELNHVSTVIAATIADATLHAGVPICVKNTSASGTAAHTLTLTGGTFDGTNSVATLNAPGEQLVWIMDSGGSGIVILNTGTVGLA